MKLTMTNLEKEVESLKALAEERRVALKAAKKPSGRPRRVPNL